MTREFTLIDYLGSSGRYQERIALAPLKVQDNAIDLITKVNRLMLSFYGAMPKDTPARIITSGFRTPAANAATPNAAKNSLHMSGQAVDIEDNDGQLATFCLADIANARTSESKSSLLEHIGLWIENPSHTKARNSAGGWNRWVHFQTRPPKSGNRVFDPGTTLPR